MAKKRRKKTAKKKTVKKSRKTTHKTKTLKIHCAQVKKPIHLTITPS